MSQFLLTTGGGGCTVQLLAMGYKPQLMISYSESDTAPVSAESRWRVIRDMTHK